MSPIQSMAWGSDAVEARLAAAVEVVGLLLLLARERRERRVVLVLTPLMPLLMLLLTPLLTLLLTLLALMMPAVSSGGKACARVADSFACAARLGADLGVLRRFFFVVGLTPAARPAAGSASGRPAASVASSCRAAACVSAAATAADA